MKKIPTVLVRDPDDRKHVLDEVTPGCEWVFTPEAVATRKWDGTCVMYDGMSWWARREVKLSKPAPPHWNRVDGDLVTGKAVGWEPISQSPFAKPFAEALAQAKEDAAEGVDLEPGTYELCGPKVNGNPDSFPSHHLMRHGRLRMTGSVRSVDDAIGMVRFADREANWEGIVWHHLDGRMAKLKARDLRPATSE